MIIKIQTRWPLDTLLHEHNELSQVIITGNIICYSRQHLYQCLPTEKKQIHSKQLCIVNASSILENVGFYPNAGFHMLLAMSSNNAFHL